MVAPAERPSGRSDDLSGPQIGHLGGANAIAAALQTAIGATAVLTTASDARGTLAVDLLDEITRLQRALQAATAHER